MSSSEINEFDNFKRVVQKSSQLQAKKLWQSEQYQKQLSSNLKKIINNKSTIKESSFLKQSYMNLINSANINNIGNLNLNLNLNSGGNSNSNSNNTFGSSSNTSNSNYRSIGSSNNNHNIGGHNNTNVHNNSNIISQKDKEFNENESLYKIKQIHENDRKIQKQFIELNLNLNNLKKFNKKLQYNFIKKEKELTRNANDLQKFAELTDQRIRILENTQRLIESNKNL
ncbi:uncharacterized protein ASCRUDRAFT_73320 [Ascoidea rubescens DSM 1968]|uniref:Uncharacterized protein n=1 Tax=Ascoidea rubescens DSM 1968 TaxID=1344418 RepID=A0A1D2VPK4_9ASCO|nr:hypothetical protein ASCRUDRAFT_73320 [Ascoidea rubescens DSM 1968]ODV63475.1 hypothetical protein ASCRUDRAFT_73320 [Ascoidea rubescens DSM 1968]